VIGTIFGTRGPTLDNPYVKGFLDVHPQFLHCLEFGTMPPVDLFPVLTYVPERFARWKRLSKKVKSIHDRLFDQLLVSVEKRVRDGQGIDNYMEELLEQGPSVGLPTRTHLSYLGGSLLGGADTSSAAIQYIFLALAKFPEVRKKAQQEMDKVVGTDRMPNENDIPKLKYIHAVVEEVLRFRPAGPLGVPHEMLEDTVINGMFFPKDAVVFTNLYGMFHDERYYDEPETFMPERFLKHPYGIKEGIEDDPARRANLVFGGGKRVCPGIAFAKASLETNAANIVWSFDILPAIDAETGKELYPDLDDYTNGLGAFPRPFPIRIRPRSAHHKDLIDRQFRSVADILSTYEYDLPLVDKEFNAKYRDL
jgi:cytochrome P450